MHHAFRDPLVVEVEKLFAKVKVVNQCGATCTDPQRILVVGDRAALRCCQDLLAVLGNLMKLASAPR